MIKNTQKIKKYDKNERKIELKYKKFCDIIKENEEKEPFHSSWTSEHAPKIFGEQLRTSRVKNREEKCKARKFCERKCFKVNDLWVGLDLELLKENAS